MRHFLVVSVALLLCSRAFAEDSCSATPKKAALDLYEKHQEFVFSEASSPPLSQALARAVNESLAEQRRTGDMGPIDWNYWTDAQDGEQSRSAKVVSITGKGASATVTLAYQFLPSPTEKPVPKRAVISVSRTSPGCWVVNDVRRGKRSVMSYLKPPQSIPAAPK
jgi:uncharacterized protein YcfL